MAVFLVGMRGLIYRLRLQFGDVSGSFLDDRPTQAMFFCVYAIALAVGWRSDRGRVDLRSVLPLSVFMGILIASTLWSIEWGRTLNQSLQMALATAAVVVLASAVRLEGVVEALMLASGLAMALSIVAVTFDWEFSSDNHGRLTGVFYNRNALGLVAATTAVSSVIWWGQRRQSSKGWVAAPVLLLITVVVWFRSGSVTAMLATVASIASGAWMGGWQRGSKRTRRRLMMAAAVCVVALIGAVVDRMVVTRWIGRDATFTGRTTTWRIVIEAWERRPWQGFGFFAGWFDLRLRQEIADVGLNHWEAHNGYLEVLLGMGLLGSAVLVWLLTELVRAVWHRRFGADGRCFVSILVFVLVVNLGETAIGANRLVWMLAVALFVSTKAPRVDPGDGTDSGARQPTSHWGN